MKKLAVILALLSSVTAFGQMGSSKSNPGSVYKAGATNPLLDRVARKAGDVVLIAINEQSSASFSAGTKVEKSDSNNVSAEVLNGFLGRIFGPLVTSGSGSTDGKGSTNSSSRMSSTMSAVVKEVLPNGTMIIEGSRTLVTNKETQTFTLSGLIRASDIMSDNTIDSTKIAEAQITMSSKGSINDRQRKGIITRLLDWLF
ncbi:MAG: flagellar basal body L-ring protein FlgH [Armatimonadetes bacterium]|nr:flagellar basal body L-ring protein FlgH [Armatimonadota bacterium]